MDAVSLVLPAIALLSAGAWLTAWVAQHLPADVVACADEGRFAGLGTAVAHDGSERAHVALPTAGVLNTSR